MSPNEPPPLSANALRVLEARYLRRDAGRRVVETPEQLFARVARAVAEAEAPPSEREAWAERFRRAMTGLEFLPNSPTLMNAGVPAGQLSACFVLPVPDTMEGIFDAVKEMALVQRTGGGTGFSFSRLRPRGDFVASTAGEASGPVSFMKIFDCATENIKQGGRRRGANMGVLRVDHPDILEFISAKDDGRSLQNFNLSVGATDAFMEAVNRDAAYDLVHPSTGRIVSRKPAREVFRSICESAWRSGDPGMVFLDAINRANPTPQLGAIEATNPCGEVPLLPHEACNLGSVNLARMIAAGTGGVAALDWRRLGGIVRLAVRFLDNVISVNRYPTPAFARMAEGNRKMGLGVMGFAECLIRLGHSYDSDAAVALAGEVMEFISREALAASEDLAAERGTYPNWPGGIHEQSGRRVRNATLTAIAPTGTIGIIADTSPGIEPLFALAYRRTNVLGGQTLVEINPLLRAHGRAHGLDVEALAREAARTGTLQGAPGLPEATRRLFATALEIPAERHLQIQAAFQRHVDNSVSKTINLPRDATAEEIGRVYRRAWELGLKGITVYRYGSRESQVLELGADEEPCQRDHASRCDPGECRV